MKKNGSNKIQIMILTICGLLLVGCNDNIDNIELGMVAIKELRYEEALSILEEELIDSKEKGMIYRAQGLAYMGLSNYQEATTSFKLALDHSIKEIGNIDYDINYYLATSMYRTGDLDGAK